MRKKIKSKYKHWISQGWNKSAAGCYDAQGKVHDKKRQRFNDYIIMKDEENKKLPWVLEKYIWTSFWNCKTEMQKRFKSLQDAKLFVESIEAKRKTIKIDWNKVKY